MAKMNVAQFAGELGLPVGLLLEQLQAAGVAKQQEADTISEQDKAQLLEHLRSAHGGGSAKAKITLTRRETSEIKKSDSTGRARTIQVEVRKKRVVAPVAAESVQTPAQPDTIQPDTVNIAQQPAVVEKTVEKTVPAPAPEVIPAKAPVRKVDEQERALREEEARSQAELAARQAAEVHGQERTQQTQGGTGCRACS